MIMEKLNQLISLCKAAVSIEVNEHRNSYEPVEQYLRLYDFGNELDPGILQEIINRDTVIVVQFYPQTPIGFYVLAHYDLEMAVDQALAVLNKTKQ